MGWGEGLERWVVDYRVIQGDPTARATWDALDELLAAAYRHPSGRQLKLRATAVDTGGTATQEVYDFTRRRRHRGILGVKGASKPGRPVIANRPSKVDINWRGRIERHGAELWQIGTDTAKDWLAGRWLLGEGAGAIHFSEDLPEGFYEQLVAEKRMARYVRGRRRSEWVKAKGEPNEALDLCVYNLAMAHFLGLHRYRDVDWERLRLQVDPPIGDLFETLPPAPALESSSDRVSAREAPQEPPKAAAPARPKKPAPPPITIAESAT
jgi:phage terminase large subunit GpA-like protein